MCGGFDFLCYNENMKTILFSNVVGDVFVENGDVTFLPKMKDIISDWGLKQPDIVYIDAPMKGYDNMAVFENIKKCFSQIFDNANFYFVNDKSRLPKLKNLENAIYFLTGGNPLSQFEIIKKKKLENTLQKCKFCIGFCAGAINLSQFGVVTSDEDFDKPLLYDALGRIPISIEPHFNFETQRKADPKGYKRRCAELETFVEEMKKPIYALPDTSLIYINGETIFQFGKVVVFGQQGKGGSKTGGQL